MQSSLFGLRAIPVQFSAVDRPTEWPLFSLTGGAPFEPTRALPAELVPQATGQAIVT